ncbi:MAG: serine/threonine-protein kinase [Planctomycetota bacterium]
MNQDEPTRAYEGGGGACHSNKPEGQQPGGFAVGGVDVDGLEVNTVEASFAVLELCLEQLTSIAPVESVDSILDLIPGVSDAAQRLILVELIKFDLAAAAADGLARTLDFYWPKCAAILPQDRIPFDLVLEEVQLLRERGEKPKWSEYRQRFPDLADTIGKWLAGGETQMQSGQTGSVPELPVNEQFDDFMVLKQLGQGAFARVYLARQISMHRLVALKATSRGSDEPKALSQLDHGNIVRVYDQREISEPQVILLYMQYLPGGTLADCVKHVRALPAEEWNGARLLESIDASLVDASQTVPEQSGVRQQIASMEWPEVVAWIGIQLSEGLHYADSKGVLHRDVKPANILLSSEAIPKLADFNVSCSGLSGRAGAAAYFGGSLAYMSPEQLQVADPTASKQAEELDGRSDLYALGIVLWELWQGSRPWRLEDIASSWTEAVRMQREIREQPLIHEPNQSNATERVLEKVLRGMLAVQPEQRPKSGLETASRLRLAFYPELANRFEPSKNSLSGRLLRLSVVLVSAILIFGPNCTAAIYNYAYNLHQMELKGDQLAALEGLPLREASNSTITSVGLLPYLQETFFWVVQGDESEYPIVRHFRWVSFIVNGIVFPLGGFLFWWIIWPLTRIVHRGKAGQSGSERNITYLWTIGLKATMVTAALWAVSGVVFSSSMWMAFPGSFSSLDAAHFFLSLVLCGGVAWIYPYFGMTLLSLLIYYPVVISPSMSDVDFDQRSSRVRRHMFGYLVSAAAIPLMAVGLLVAGNVEKTWVLSGVGLTAVGLAFAFYAYNKIDEGLAQFGKVLGNRDEQSLV